MTNNQLISVLTSFYLDKTCMSSYHGRWDTWLVVNNHMHEYFILMMKTDEQIKRMTDCAKDEAEKVKNSSLNKAMNENTIKTK